MAQASILKAPSGTRHAGRPADVLSRARADSVEFPRFLANHLPMMLVALDRLGADSRRLEEYSEAYRAASPLVPVADPESARIGRNNWRDHLGQRDFEADYRNFFAAEVARLGSGPAQAAYLPELALGIAASALHALMRLAYANLAGDAGEVAVGLGYLASCYLVLGLQRSENRRSEEPLDILLALRERLAHASPQPESDLLWHWMRAVAALPGFAATPGALIVTPSTLSKLRGASLALLASTMTFEALHALTGCHWLRLLEANGAAQPVLLSGFWTAIAAVYPKIGMPLPLDAQALETMRANPRVPDWRYIVAEAIKRNDEHDISLTFSAREEWLLTQDPLYKVVAARRLGLVV